MSCSTCGRYRQWHGSETGSPGTYLNESGCHDGVHMDDDEYFEGWQADTLYHPCPHNSARCRKCKGTGSTKDGGECRPCHGTGWKNGDAQWPIPADDDLVEDDNTQSPEPQPDAHPHREQSQDRGGEDA